MNALLGLAMPVAAQTHSTPIPDPFEESSPGLLVPLPDSLPSPVVPLQLEDLRIQPEAISPNPTVEEAMPFDEVIEGQTEDGRTEEERGGGRSEGPPVTFRVSEIQVLGNTRFESEIEALVRDLEAQDITLADLLTLRAEITKLYVDAGYISSGAFVPANQVFENNGTVSIQVVEGELEQIQILGLNRLRERYVRNRLRRAAQPPLNVNRLEQELQLLQVDPLLQSVNADLTAGSGPGENILVLDLTEADAFWGRFEIDNYRSPSIGSLQGTATVEHLNLLGLGDRLNLGYGLTEGLDTYQTNYTLPVNGRGGTAQIRYQTSESNIVEDAFAEAGIRSESDTLSLNFRQPISRSISHEFTLGIGFDRRVSRSFILDDMPFSFSVGPEEGVSKVSALRFSQEWVNRDRNTVLAARSQFNVGLGLFDATVNNLGTDGRFFSWQGQFQWVEQFSPETLLLTRLNTQLTPDSLLPLERFSIGGINTVRGYAQNQLVTDNAVTLSTELRFPVAEGLQLTPFIDAGGGWNNQAPNLNPSFLLGTGLGLRWQPLDYLNLRLDYGIPLISANDKGNSLQENGFYFSLNLLPF
ncbi:MAG: ShlB/FhaC/HecB family hemolysin secretion/activation protein [Phormidesmis sp.]